MRQSAISFLVVVVLGCALLTATAKPQGEANNRSNKTQPQPSSRGLALIKAHQCLTCHTLEGSGARDGISLDHLKRDRKFIIDHVLDPEGNVAKNPAAFQGDPNLMPSHQLSRGEAAAIADFLLAAKPNQVSAAPESASVKGKRLYQSLNCSMCHSINDSGGCMGPALGGVTKRRSDAYLKLRLNKGSEAQFIALIKHPELFPHPRFSSGEVTNLVAYLKTLEGEKLSVPMKHQLTKKVSDKAPDLSASNSTASSANASIGKANPEGRRLFTQMGCLSCHSVGETGGAVAPSLDGIGTRRSREYIEAHISNPDAHFQKLFLGKRTSKMAQSGLFPEEVQNLTEFLLSLPPDSPTKGR